MHGLGLPGASSHWNGTEAVVPHGGGVSSNIPGDSCGLLGSENKESFGVELGSFSGSNPINPLSLSLKAQYFSKNSKTHFSVWKNMQTQLIILSLSEVGV